MARKGHNSGGIASEMLRDFVQLIEQLETEKRTLADDIRKEYRAAKESGFDVKALRQLIRERQQDADAREEQERILETYRAALGELADTPLGAAAMARHDGREHAVDGDA